MISWPVEVADSSGSEPRRPVIIMRATERAAEELKERAAMVGAEAARRRVGRMEAKVFILKVWIKWKDEGMVVFGVGTLGLACRSQEARARARLVM